MSKHRIGFDQDEMIRLLLTTVFCALTSLQAGAQNKVNETLLGLGEEERNEASCKIAGALSYLVFRFRGVTRCTTSFVDARPPSSRKVLGPLVTEFVRNLFKVTLAKTLPIVGEPRFGE
jgi:hypothetical protein